MKSIFTLLSLIAALALAVPAPTMAAGKKKSDDSSASEEGKGDTKKRDTYPYHGEVEDITPTLLTLKSKSKEGGRKLDITGDTKFKNGKEAATLKDVKKGAEVGGLCKKAEGGKGNEIALSLNIGLKEKGDKKDADAKPAAKSDTDKAAPSKPDTTKTDDKPTGKKTKKKKTDADSTTTPKSN